MTLNLGSAFPDSLEPCVAPEPFDRQILHETHSAVNLYCIIGQPVQHLRGKELAHCGIGGRHLPGIGFARCVHDEKVCCLKFGSHIGEFE